MHRYLTVVLLVGTTIGAMGCSPNGVMTKEIYLAGARNTVRDISPKQAQTRLAGGEDIFLMDVRMKAEYDVAHIKGCRLIPRGVIEFSMVKNKMFVDINSGQVPRPDQPVFVYCRTGGRGLLASKTLVEMGFGEVRNIAGGIAGWAEASLPVVGEVPPEWIRALRSSTEPAEPGTE